MKKIALPLLILMLTVIMVVISGCGHEHEYGEWTVQTAVTCTEDGVEVRKCNGCDETETQTISATGHQFGEWSEITAASCEENGLKERVCIGCGLKEEEAIPATGHSFAAATLLAAKTCTVCGTTEGEPLATVVNFGETIEAEGYQFVIDDAYYSTKISETRGNHTWNFGTEGNYFIVKLSFTNKSAEPLEDGHSNRFSDISLHYADKYDYKGDYRVLAANEIVPLGTENLYIYFSVPELLKNDLKLQVQLEHL